MKRERFTFLLALALFFGVAAQNISAQEKTGQDKGPWRPVSKTAESITGEVTLGNEKIAIGFATFPIAEIRALKEPEAAALFAAEAGDPGGGNVYRVSIPAAQKLQHKNNLCGNEETDWIVSYASGRTLQLAFFSGKKLPELTVDALNTTSTLCGIYTYSR